MSPVDEKAKIIQAAITKIEKSNGLRFNRLGDKVNAPVAHTSTGIWRLDHELIGIGGVPKGKMIEIIGPECLDEKTHVKFTCWNSDGQRMNHKGGTIKTLWKRFHHNNVHHNTMPHAYITLPSVNEHNRIVHNVVENVVDAGVKQCFELITKSGKTIVASAEHRFLGKDMAWRKLRNLMLGDEIFIHSNAHWKVNDPAPFRNYPEQTLKNHPRAKPLSRKVSTKKPSGKVYEYEYVRYRVAKHRLSVEAQINGLSYNEYVDRLNSGVGLDRLKMLDGDLDVHHADENTLDYSPDNLIVMTPNQHGNHHAVERHNNLRYEVVLDTVIAINPVGERRTYDICMKEPYNNFVANGIVVHNSSGKTTLTLHIAAQAQKAGGEVAFVDAEHALSPTYASQLGVDVNNLLVAQPDWGEQALQAVEDLVDTKAISVIIVDSVAALLPKAELEGEIGDSHVGLQARLMGQALRKLVAKCNQSATTILWINQIREKIGVTFGSNETTPGGRALKFYCSVRIDVRRLAQVKVGEENAGNKTKVKCIKNKVGIPFRSADMELMFGQGIDSVGSLVDCAIAHDVWKQSGKNYMLGSTGEVIMGRKNLRDELAGNAELYKATEVEVLKALGKDQAYIDAVIAK